MRRFTTAAAVALLIGAVAGCGSGGDAAKPATTTRSAATTAAGSSAAVPTATGSGGSAQAIPSKLPSRDDVNVDARDYQQGDSYYFQSPSKNIKCALSVSNYTAGCQLKHASVIPPTISGCANDNTQAVAAQIEGTAPSFMCWNQGVFVGSPVDGSDEGGGKILAYGRTIGVQGTICESLSAGIRCSVGNHGFFVAADQQKLF
ncbi:DUF6636 domain-containing protein [Nocardia gipuzkoensis]